VLLEYDLVRQNCPLLAEAIRHVGNVRVRNRGTIGGSLAMPTRRRRSAPACWRQAHASSSGVWTTLE
jgi:CO/xanthine dehydrogenase FAD-binding subunit